MPEWCPEQDQGLWGGEGVVKGYRESDAFLKKKVLPRHWVPHLYFPNVGKSVLYSEILDKYLRIICTERTMRLIEDAFGFDFYILKTSEIDLNSKLGCWLKRLLFIRLAKEDYYMEDEERHGKLQIFKYFLYKENCSYSHFH